MQENRVIHRIHRRKNTGLLKKRYALFGDPAEAWKKQDPVYPLFYEHPGKNDKRYKDIKKVRQPRMERGCREWIQPSMFMKYRKMPSQVSRLTMPVTSRPCSDWKVMTAVWVAGSKVPVIPSCSR